MRLNNLFEHLYEKPLEEVKAWASSHRGMLFHGSRNKFTSFKSSVASQNLGIHFASDAALASWFTAIGSSSDWGSHLHDGTHQRVKRDGVGGFLLDMISPKRETKYSYLYAVNANGLHFLDLRPLLKVSDIVEWSYQELFRHLKKAGILYDLLPELKGVSRSNIKKMFASGELFSEFKYDGFIYENSWGSEAKNAVDKTCYLVLSKSLNKLNIVDVYHVDPLDHENTNRSDADVKRLEKRQAALSEAKNDEGQFVNYRWYNANDEEHRLDGPAVIEHKRFGSYTAQWYVNGYFCEFGGQYHFNDMSNNKIPLDFLWRLTHDRYHPYNKQQVMDVLNNLIKLGYDNEEHRAKLKKHIEEWFGEDR